MNRANGHPGIEEWSSRWRRLLDDSTDWARLLHQRLAALTSGHFDGLLEPSLIHPGAQIHPTAVLEPAVFVGEGVLVGPGCYVRARSIILAGTHLGHNVEVSSAVIDTNVQIHHTAVVCNSYVGPDSNLAFGFATATRRLDGQSVRCSIGDGETWTSPAKHHGSVVGRLVKTGVNVALMPGTTVAGGSVLMPGATMRGYVGPTSPEEEPVSC